MKINTPVKINITSLKPMIDCSVDKVLVPELMTADAVVSGKKDENGDKIMIINGNIEMEDIEDIFYNHGVDVDDYIVTDIDMIPDYDDVEVFDSLKKNVKGNKINEKKPDCCPPKKSTNGNIVNLYEALKGKTEIKNENVASLNAVIDSISGKSLSESVRKIAIEKANAEYLKEKLGTDKYNAVVESLNANAQSLHADTKINGKRIAEYSTDELRELLKKVNEQIDDLNKKVADGINEANGDKKISEVLAVKNRVKTILDDEISFRDAMVIKEENETSDAPSMEFKNLNPNVSDEESSKKDDESVEPKNESDENENNDDNSSDSEKSEKDDEENPDEDEVVELGSVVITLASEDAANDLKKDLVDAGVPEDAIDIEPVEDEKSDEEDNESDTSDEDASSDTEENNSTDDEHQDESINTAISNVVNEDDDSNDVDDAESPEDATDDADDSSDEDKAYKLILTDTDYVSELATVLQDIWGMDKEEFEELIGGEIIDNDDNSESDDTTEDNDSTDAGDSSEEDSDSDDLDDFDPDEIFKDL